MNVELGSYRAACFRIEQSVSGTQGTGLRKAIKNGVGGQEEKAKQKQNTLGSRDASCSGRLVQQADAPHY